MTVSSGRERRQCINVSIINNILPDSQRQFQLTVSSDSHSVSVTPANVTILDDGMIINSEFYQVI